MKTKIYIAILISAISFTLNAQTTNLAGNTLNHNGTTSVNIGNADLSLSNQFTIMYWVKWNINPQDGNQWSNMVTMNSTTHSDRGQFWLQHNSNNSKFEFALATLGSNGQSSRNFIYSNTTPEQGVWYHVAAVYDGSRMMLYVNGILENSRNKSGQVFPFQADFNLNIAAWAHTNNNYRAINGQLDELSIWNIALTENQINDFMNNLLNPVEDGLIAYYRFDETEGTIVNDLTGNGFDGENVSLNGGQPAEILNSDAPIFGLLPIDLIYFTANASDNSVLLEWASASEINNDYYTIYRSNDGTNWNEIARTSGAGNSVNTLYYNYEDTNPLAGQNYYMLRQTDFDGKFEEFNILAVNISIVVSEVSIYPNPAQDLINIDYLFSDDIESIIINVINSAGTTVISEKIENNGFNNQTRIDLSNLKNGVYFVQINSEITNLNNTKIIVNK